MLEGSMQKKYQRQRCDHFIFPFADGTAKFCGRDHEVRDSSLRGVEISKGYNLVHKFIPVPEGHELPGCEGSSEQGMEKAREKSSMATGKTSRGGYSGSKRRQKIVHFASLICHFKNAELEPEFQKYHLAKNDYSFDALQTNCFGINLKL